METMLPGSGVMVPKFDLTWIDMELMKPNKVGEHLTVTPYPAYHTAETNPTSVRCVAGPTKPQPPFADGEAAWRLISHLSLNYLSLGDSDESQGAASLRELGAMLRRSE